MEAQLILDKVSTLEAIVKENYPDRSSIVDLTLYSDGSGCYILSEYRSSCDWTLLCDDFNSLDELMLKLDKEIERARNKELSWD